MTARQSKKVTLFTFVNTDIGYVKQPITLYKLVTQLSDKKSKAARSISKNITCTRDNKTLATSEPIQKII